jgi:hypothetical protein
MTATAARNLTKKVLNIPAATVTFDTDIDDYVTQAVQLLYPLAPIEIDADTTVVIGSDNRTASLPSGVLDVAELEIYDSDNSDYYPTNEYRIHNGKIKMDTYLLAGTRLRIWGLGAYAITTLPTYLEMVVIYWTVSIFYAALAGNKRKYNLYVGAAGAAGDRDMKDSVDFFRGQGNDLLADRIAIRGA